MLHLNKKDDLLSIYNGLFENLVSFVSSVPDNASFVSEINNSVQRDEGFARGVSIKIVKRYF